MTKLCATGLKLLLTCTYILSLISPQSMAATPGKDGAVTYAYKLTADGFTYLVVDAASPDVPVAELKLNSQDELLKYSPKNLKLKLKDLARINYMAAKHGVRHTVMNLPVEASVFYMAMGTAAAFELFHNFGENPAGLQLFIDGQASAVGATSLFIFLASQNAISNMASLAIRNPKWRFMIPYLGMTAGAMIQSYATSFMTDPNVKGCLREWMGNQEPVIGADTEPCEKAYRYITMQKPWEFAPGLASMLVSAGIVAGGQQALSLGTKGAVKSLAKREIVKIIGTRIAGLISPVSWPFLMVDGIWVYLSKYSNLTAFATVDHAIMHSITSTLRNLQESSKLPLVRTLYKTSDNLAFFLAEEKTNDWNVTTNGFLAEIKNFGEDMRSWRMANIEDILTSHDSWQTYLSDSVQRYEASKEFYSRFVDQARILVNYGDPDDEKLLNRIYPFNGIPTSLTKDLDETHYTSPHLPESEQIVTALKFRDEIINYLKSPQFTQKYSSEFETNLKQIVQTYLVGNLGNSQADKIRLAKGMNGVLQYLLIAKGSSGKDKMVFYEVLKIYQQLGQFSPKLRPGEGFVASQNKSPLLNAYYQGIKPPTSPVYVTNPSDFFVASMICGPDAESNEPLLLSRWGFPADFRPPRITDSKAELNRSGKPGESSFYSQLCEPILGSSIETIYEDNGVVGLYPWRKDKPLVSYKSYFEYLKFNVKPSILGTSAKPAFNTWWTQHVDPQMTNSFKYFQKSYTEIVAKLLPRLSQQENSIWNSSETAANGVFQSALQDLRVHLLILGEIYKDGYRKKFGDNLPVQIFSRLPDGPNSSGTSVSANVPEIIKLQMTESNLDFDRIAKNYPNFAYKGKAKEAVQLRIQERLETEFKKLLNAIGSLKVQDVNGEHAVVGSIKNSDLQAQVDVIEALNVEFAKMMGLGSELDDADRLNDFVASFKSQTIKETKGSLPSPTDLDLSPAARMFAVQCLKNISSLSYEIMGYGLMVNAVNLDSLRNIDRLSKEYADRENKIQTIFEGAKGHRSIGH